MRFDSRLIFSDHVIINERMRAEDYRSPIFSDHVIINVAIAVGEYCNKFLVIM